MLTFDALAAELSARLDREIAWLDVPNAASRTALSEAGVPEYNVRLLGDMFTSISARPHPTLTDDVVPSPSSVPRSVSQWAAECSPPPCRRARWRRASGRGASESLRRGSNRPDRGRTRGS